MKEEQIYRLYARKLAAELSPEEAKELTDLLEQRPDLEARLKIFEAWWAVKPALAVDLFVPQRPGG